MFASGTGVDPKVYVVHGSLMLVAWLALSPIATATARYAQSTNKATWFKIHLSLQVWPSYSAEWRGVDRTAKRRRLGRDTLRLPVEKALPID